MSQLTLKSMKASFGMTKQRCYNRKCADYPYYGGRGITICERWLENFDNLVADMGLRPEGMTLERLDNDGPYSPDNCVWATRKQQAGNRKTSLQITYNGETKTVAEWAEATGIPYSTLKARITRLGYSAKDALTKPVKCGGLLEGKQYKKRRPPDTSRVPRGFDSKLTALTRAQAAEMQEKYAAGSTFTSLAKEYGVCVETASQAAQGEKFYGQLGELND